MTIDEAKAIHEKFLPTVKMEYLLQSDGDKPTYEEQLAAYADMVHEHASGPRNAPEAA